MYRLLLIFSLLINLSLGLFMLKPQENKRYEIMNSKQDYILLDSKIGSTWIFSNTCDTEPYCWKHLKFNTLEKLPEGEKENVKLN